MTGYIGIGDKAKKIKNIYIGVGGKAKQVKKAYIGIGNKAKLWYSSSNLAALFADMVVDASASRSSSSTAYLEMRPTHENGVKWIWYERGGLIGIYKVVTTISGGTASYTTTTLLSGVDITVNSQGYSTLVRSETQVYAGSMIAVKFPNFAEAQVDEMLSNMNITCPASNYGSSGSQVSVSKSNFHADSSHLYFAANAVDTTCRMSIAYGDSIATAIFSTASPAISYVYEYNTDYKLVSSEYGYASSTRAGGIYEITL